MALKGGVSSDLSGFQANWPGTERHRAGSVCEGAFLLALTGACCAPGGGSHCGRSSAQE